MHHQTRLLLASRFAWSQRPISSLSSLNWHALVLLHCARVRLKPDWLYVNIQVDQDRECMPYYDVANHHVIVKHQCQTDECDTLNGACGSRTIRTTTVRIAHQELSLLHPLHSGLSSSPSLTQTCTEVSAAPTFDYSISKRLYHFECTSITAGAFRCTWKCSCSIWERIA